MKDQSCIVTFGGDRTINIKFRYVPYDSKEPRTYTLKRDQDETVKSLCRRIGLNLVGKNNRNTETPDVYFTKKNSRVADELPISELFKEEISQFHINRVAYEILIEPQEVKKVVLPKSQIFVGFTLVPIIDCSNCSFPQCKISWYRSQNGKPNTWVKIDSNDIFYSPQTEDEGHYLKLECLPPKGDLLFGAEAVSGCRVKRGPECLFRERILTSQMPEGTFTCTSYNILADLYGDPDIKTKKSMFPYCPKEALRFDYRKNLILEELIYYKSDIYCLQEVDKDFFSKDLATYFICQNYEVVFNEKLEKDEGLAILVNKSKFKVLSSCSIAYGRELKSNPLFESLKAYISANSPALLKKLLWLGTVLQIVEVSTEDDRHLFIANTHLYYAPGFTILRLVQSYIGIRYLEDLMKDKKHALIWCGDFNSSPQYSTYSFLSTSTLPADHPDWTSTPECSLRGMELAHSLKLQSAYGTPAFTNYTKDFVACLDYILVDSEQIELCQTLPMPSEERVSEHQALPSPVHPSDHIALVAILKLKPLI